MTYLVSNTKINEEKNSFLIYIHAGSRHVMCLAFLYVPEVEMSCVLATLNYLLSTFKVALSTA